MAGEEQLKIFSSSNQSLSERWETIGARKPETIAPPRADDRRHFSRVGASQRMVRIGREHGPDFTSTDAGQAPSKPLSAQEWIKRGSKSASFHVDPKLAGQAAEPVGPRIEAGNPLRLLRWSRSECEIEAMPVRTHDVERGLAELRAQKAVPSPLMRRQVAAPKSWEVPWHVPPARRQSVSPPVGQQRRISTGFSSGLSPAAAASTLPRQTSLPSQGTTPAFRQTVRLEPEPEEAPMDFVEANLFGTKAQGAVGKEEYDRQMQVSLRRLAEQEPPVGQLLEYMLTAFKTLRLAFRQMDSNHNGSLTKSEFVDSLKVIRSNTGLKAFDHHVGALFSEIRERAGKTADTGHVTASQLASSLSAGDGGSLSGRLAGFLVKGERANREMTTPSQTEVVEKVQALFVRQDDEKISKKEFVDGIVRLRYDDWHFNDIFNRMDQDGSGSLGIAEFTAFLDPGAVAPRRPRKQYEMLGSEERKRQIQGMHSTGAVSTRLQQTGRRKSSIGSHLAGEAPKAVSPSSGFSATGWAVAAGGSLEYQRPDYLGAVRKGLGPRRLEWSSSELALAGRCTVQVTRSPEKAPDLLPPRWVGLEDFDEKAPRTVMDVV